MDRPPKDIAKEMLRAAMQPYCTDVIPLTVGAHRIDYLEEAIRAFLDAEHAVLQVQVPRIGAQTTLRQARGLLIRQSRWKPNPG